MPDALRESDLTVFSGRTTHKDRETPCRRHIRSFDPPRARVLVDTCRNRQQEERVRWPEIPLLTSLIPLSQKKPGGRKLEPGCRGHHRLKLDIMY